MSAAIEVLYQYDPHHAPRRQAPTTAHAAQQELTAGNRAFSEVLTDAEAGIPMTRKVVRLAATDLGLAPAGSEAPAQQPFAAVLSCADARAPVEMILWQQVNELFVVRVAGNTAGDQSMGSLFYAVNHLPSIQLLVVLGHTGCGAVTAAVDAFLEPTSYMGIADDLPLRSIVDSIMLAVCGSAAALSEIYGEGVKNRPGYRTALVELAVIMNTSLTAAAVRQTFLPKLGPNLQVVFGVFNLRNHVVGLPDSAAPENTWLAGLRAAPQAAADFAALKVARSRYITEHLL